VRFPLISLLRTLLPNIQAVANAVHHPMRTPAANVRRTPGGFQSWKLKESAMQPILEQAIADKRREEVRNSKMSEYEDWLMQNILCERVKREQQA